MKNSIKTALTLILIGILLVGAGLMGGAQTSIGPSDLPYSTNRWLNKFFTFNNFKIFNNNREWKHKNAFDNIKLKNLKVEENEKVFDSVSSIDINLEFAEIEVIRSENEEAKITYHTLYNNRDTVYNLSIRQNEGSINIYQKRTDYTLNNLGFSEPDISILLEIPENIDLKMETGTGEIVISDLGFEKLSFSISAGSIKLDNIKTNNLNLNTSLGETRIIDSEINNYLINTNAGKLYSENSRFKSGKFAADMGQIKLKDSELADSEIKTSTGEINLSGKIFGHCSMSADLGAIHVDLDQDKKDVGLNTNTDLGETSVDGKRMNFAESPSLFDNFLDIQTNMGQIKLNFK